jgi:hypothetical protein
LKTDIDYMKAPKYLTVHTHFYQPPRGNPFDESPLIEPSAAPFRNWNERITAECYKPNADVGNLRRVSFNLGETLAGWLADNAPDTYAEFIASDRQNREQYGVGNGIAQPMHHTILPLATREDKVTQVRWGKAVFAYRFGHETTGMWLPEMAVDLETLEVLAEEDVEWTILSTNQVVDRSAGAGPYTVHLPSGKTMTVFVRDEDLSNYIAFNLGHLGGAGRWAKEVLQPRLEEAGPLTLIASDGETFGHHWPGEHQFLHWLLTVEAERAGYQVTTLARFARDNHPATPLQLRERTAWSCMHGVARWSTGCDCTQGNSSWKKILRSAMEDLRVQIDGIYQDEVRSKTTVDPIALRDAYIDVVLEKVPPERFLSANGVDLPTSDAQHILKLVEAQFYRQRMFASCAFFFAEQESLSTRYGIANASYAIQLTQEATGIDLLDRFRSNLEAVQNKPQPHAMSSNGSLILEPS